MKLRPRNILLVILPISLAVAVWIAGYARRHTVSFDPGDVETLAVYDLNPLHNREYVTSYTNASRYVLTPAETRLLFAQTDEEAIWIWKGAFLGVVTTRTGRTFHLAISNSGGFARVLENGQPIRFVGASGREYERIKSAAHTNVFIPARSAKNRATQFGE